MSLWGQEVRTVITEDSGMSDSWAPGLAESDSAWFSSLVQFVCADQNSAIGPKEPLRPFRRSGQSGTWSILHLTDYTAAGLSWPAPEPGALWYTVCSALNRWIRFKLSSVSFHTEKNPANQKKMRHWQPGENVLSSHWSDVFGVWTQEEALICSNIKKTTDFCKCSTTIEPTRVWLNQTDLHRPEEVLAAFT